MKINSLLKKTVLAAAVPALFVAASSASAALITKWDFEVGAGFQNSVQADGLGGGDVLTPSGVGLGTGNKLSWGVPSTAGTNPTQTRSSIEVVNGTTGTLITSQDGILDRTTQPGDFQQSSKLTHANFVQKTGSSKLKSTELITTLLLKPIQPPGGANLPLGPITFNITFEETPNAGPGCVAPDAAGCQDIFVVKNPGALTFGGIVNPTPGFDDAVYTVSLAVDGLGPLTAAQCAAANAAAGCIGFLTKENQLNSFNVYVAIDGKLRPTVAEPGVLGLFGLSLAGLGLMARRRKA